MWVGGAGGIRDFGTYLADLGVRVMRAQAINTKLRRSDTHLKLL